MRFLRWFLAGALAVPLGHQLVLWLFHAIGFTDRAPFAMTATKPFGMPAVVSLAFWGGVWGILLGLVLARVRPERFWIVAAIFGSVAPTLVAGLVVAPLKGQPMPAGPRMIVLGLSVNLAWALVTAALARLISRDDA